MPTPHPHALPPSLTHARSPSPRTPPHSHTPTPQELFETCGALAKHAVHYDDSGRSEGTAAVVFRNAADAEAALRRYNNVQLDGQAMQVGPAGVRCGVGRGGAARRGGVVWGCWWRRPVAVRRRYLGLRG